MRSAEEVHEVLSFVDQGMNDCEISRRTGIPRCTVRGWRVGNLPSCTGVAPLQACEVCGHPQHDFGLLPLREYCYLLGLYLGDGCITTHARGVHRLGISLDRAYPGIVGECKAAMTVVMPRSRVNVIPRHAEQTDDVLSYSKAWPCFMPQHGPGKKHMRKLELVEWQWRLIKTDPRPLLRGLIHSDGSRHINTIRHPKRTYRYPRYEFTNLSADIKRIFCDACDLLGIEWRVMNRKAISIARRDSVAVVDEFVGPKR
jgi:hypothetical protein